MVYLDYAATCPVVKYPQQLYREVLGEGYFLNPNANYAYKEKRLLEQAENRAKKAVGAKSGKVVFGGTSSQLIENLMSAVAEETYFYQVLCSDFEHDSCFRFHNGTINTTILLDKLLKSYQCNPEEHDYDSVFIMWQGVNNITGEIFPVTEIGDICHKHDTFYICDATAMIGHTNIPENIDKWCDAFIMDGHKLGTELGIGAMWISDNLDRWLNGFKRHGTPNLAGALSMTQAVEDACIGKNIQKHNKLWDKLSDKLESLLNKNNIKHTFVPFVLNEWTTAINAIRLPGINARALQSYLASKEIYIGLGQSSCANEADRRILCQGYGLSEQEADEVVRISFGEDSNVEDVKALIDGIAAFRKEYL